MIRQLDRTKFRTIVVATVALSMLGCGNESLSRQSISGSVTVSAKDPNQKRQSPRGSLTLLPTGGQSGPAASTPIVNGRYEFSSVSGPFPGTYRVIVQLVPNPTAATSLENAIPRGKADLLVAGTEKPGKSDPGTRVIEYQTSVEIEVGTDRPYDFTFPPR